MAKAIEAGIPKMRIEEAAARTQARIDSGQQPVIGVNKYPSTRTRDRGPQGRQRRGARRADRQARALRAERDEARHAGARRKLTWAAGERDPTDPERNLLKLAIDAARAKATVGEISDALEKEFGRYTAQIRTISGVYSKEAGPTATVQEAQRLVEKFEEARGPPPAHPGRQDGPGRPRPRPEGDRDRLRRPRLRRRRGPAVPDAGGGRPPGVEADVHVVGVSSLAAGHLTLVPALRAELDKLGRDDLMIVVGGVIPSQDFEELREHGADAIYPPGNRWLDPR
jgi:methylmalonyl-CoA mutase